MKKTITIIGANPGLGLSLAKKFESNDFNVALVARNENTLISLVKELKDLNIESKYYVADLSNLDLLSSTLKTIESDFGKIDLVDFSPYAGHQTFRNVETMTIEEV